MNNETANKIYQEIEDEWVRRHGRENLDPKTMLITHKLIQSMPDEDGCKRVKSMETGKTHLVPIKDIILDGIKGSEIHKYPEEKKGSHAFH